MTIGRFVIPDLLPGVNVLEWRTGLASLTPGDVSRERNRPL